MKKESIVLLIVIVLATAGLAIKNKQISDLKKQRVELYNQVAEYKWKFEHLNYVCDMEDE